MNRRGEKGREQERREEMNRRGEKGGGQERREENE